MEPLKGYRVKRSQANMMMIIGGFMVLLGLILGVLSGHFSQFGIGILFVIIGYLQREKDVIKMFERYMEIKPAPLAGTKLIKYADIKEIEVVSEKKVYMHGMVSGQNKKYRFPVNVLSEEDRNDFLNTLEEKTADSIIRQGA